MKTRIFGAAVFVGAVFSLTSCFTEKNLPKHNDKFPLAAARYFMEKYPSKDSTGGTDSVEHHQDSLATANNENYQPLIDSLSYAIDSLNHYWLMLHDSVLWQLNGAFQKELVKQQQESIKLKASMQRLKEAYQPCKPDTIFRTKTISTTKTIWKRDSAARAAAKLAVQELDAKILELTKVKGTSSTRLWMFRASAVLNLLFIVLLTRKKSHPLKNLS